LNVLCEFFEGDHATVATQYMCRVQCFVKVVRPVPQADGDAGAAENADGEPAAEHADRVEALRLAAVDGFAADDVDWGAGELLHCPGYPQHHKFTAAAVCMSLSPEGWGEMRSKYAMALTPDAGAYFMPYSNMSDSGAE
jgi:hypothetical protein